MRACVCVCKSKRNQPIALPKSVLYSSESRVVKEEFRGQGVGRQLVGSWLDMLKAQGVRKAYLEVWSDNQSAIGFYKALGFKVKPGLSYLPFKCCNKPYPITMVYQCQ